MEVEIEFKEQKSLLQEIEKDFDEIWKKNKIRKAETRISEINFQNHSDLNNMEAAVNLFVAHKVEQQDLNGQVLKEAGEQETQKNVKVENKSELIQPSAMRNFQRQISQLKWKETQILKEKIAEITEEKNILEDKLSRIKCKNSIEKLQFKELQDSLKSEQYFSALYKTQAAELKQELEEKERQYNDVEEKCASLKQQRQIYIQEFDVDAEKDKTVKPKDVVIKFCGDVEGTNYISNGYENNLKVLNERILKEKDDLAKQFKQIQGKFTEKTDEGDELNVLRAQLKTEQILKAEAINKLHEIINRTDYYKINVELKRNENNLKKLEQELTLEKEKFNQLQKNQQDLTNQLNEEIMIKHDLQMELDSKDSVIEQLQLKLTSLNYETVSNSNENEDEDCTIDSVFEGWLSIHNKQNIKQDGWKKQFVVVSSKKLIVYNSESDKQNTDPVIVLDLCKIFHVRSVTHSDVTADPNDIPRIFQVLYACEGEARKSYEQPNDKAEILMHKGHEFLLFSYHMPATCEVCPKSLWHMFKPPAALECRRCRIKIHKEHLESKEDVSPCKMHYDAKEMLLLAPSSDEQERWVNRLSKKVQKCGYKANSSKVTDLESIV